METNEKIPVEDKIQSCINMLREIRNSGYWPYASPAPCSTEMKIKKNLDSAAASLENALYWHNQMFTSHHRDPYTAPSTIIVQ